MDGERRRQEAQPASHPSDTLAIPPSSRLTPEIPTDVFKVRFLLKTDICLTVIVNNLWTDSPEVVLYLV